MSSAILEQLYYETAAALRAYLARRSRADRSAADDLLQDVFVRAATNVERLRQTVSPRAWLFGIARNLAATHSRHRRAAVPLPDTLVDERTPDHRVDTLREAITALSDRDREILELRLRDELSYAEIAAVLTIPIGTVRSRLHNAVQRLREALIDDTEMKEAKS